MRRRRDPRLGVADCCGLRTIIGDSGRMGRLLRKDVAPSASPVFLRRWTTSRPRGTLSGATHAHGAGRVLRIRKGDRTYRPRGGLVGSLFTLVGAVLAVAGPATVYADPGDLDPSFSRDGRVLTDIAGDDKATAIATQPDG